MGYVVAGYSIVLAVLFLYGLSLVWRRRRLERAVERVARANPSPPAGTGPAGRLAGHPR
jgi:uncharacterized protein (TIGR03382 family)